MAARGQDVIGFTRIFVLFCSLVLVPALFLSGFGVIAILNERQAEKQRRFENANAVLRDAERLFGELLDATDSAVVQALDSRNPAAALDARAAGPLPLGPWVILEGDGTVVDGRPPFSTDSALLAHIADLASRAGRARPAHAAVDVPGFSGVISIQRMRDDRAVVYVVDDAKVDAAVRSKFTGPLIAGVRVTGGSAQPVENAVERLLEIVRERTNADGSASEELTWRSLDPPFERFTIFVESTARERHFTMIAYIVLLVVFLATLITGVVITARLIWQETRLSRLKTDFVSHMSHELRTPLTSIRMFIETLRLGRTSPEEAEECLLLLAKETERLSEMIERVLGYARLRAGRRLFSPGAVAVKDIVDDTLTAFRAHNLASDDDLVLTTDVPEGLPDVYADRDALTEALLNLVGNAYKYSGPHKHITVFARPMRRRRVIVGVRDNGPGLPKVEHKRVFERFYQAGGLLSSAKPGSGLGLAITRAIVEGNGGKIHVESEPGKGATFVIELRHAGDVSPA